MCQLFQWTCDDELRPVLIADLRHSNNLQLHAFAVIPLVGRINYIPGYF